MKGQKNRCLRCGCQGISLISSFHYQSPLCSKIHGTQLSKFPETKMMYIVLNLSILQLFSAFGNGW